LDANATMKWSCPLCADHFRDYVVYRGLAVAHVVDELQTRLVCYRLKKKKLSMPPLARFGTETLRANIDIKRFGTG
jgi:hypothetical protein